MATLNHFVKFEGLSFDDVLLLPDYTEIKREDISSHLTPTIKLKIPLVSSPMDTVTEEKLAKAIALEGGIGIIHRNLSINKQSIMVRKIKNSGLMSGAAVGVGRDLEERVESLVTAGVDVIVVDSAHGFSKFIIEATSSIKKTYPQVPLISGNVATYEGALALIKAGADALRVGMGPGSICTTRIISGMGVPQLTAILETVRAAKPYKIPVIADGGIRYSGDITKALAAGASTVMIGSLFAGTEEAPGKTVIINGRKYKSYRGMGSISAMKEGGAARYGQEYKKEKPLIAEGIEGLVPYRGKLTNLVFQLTGGLRAGMYYLGAKDIVELQRKARFIKITHGSLIESHPHDIFNSKPEENYVKE